MKEQIPKISIQIVTWNSRRFIKECLDSILAQTYRNFSVLIVDNASCDSTVEFVEKNYPNPNSLLAKAKKILNSRPSIFVFRNIKNLGFSGAHNLGLTLGQADFVLVMNPDILLEPDFLEKIIKTAQENESAASFGGKILKIKFDQEELAEKVKTNIFDSTGLLFLKNSRIVDRGENEEDRGQYDKKEEVFGISGACVLYRKSALEETKIKTDSSKAGSEYFDEQFFAYKEDADLAWRLRLAGFGAIYEPEAKAYHFRQGAPKDRRFYQSQTVNFFSYRNHLWMVLKNIYWKNFFSRFLFIFWYQLLKTFYLFFRQPKNLFLAKLSFFRGLPEMLRKRKYILKMAKVGPEEIKKWTK
ncbi:MAG: glycosyltransferase family 2 protein [Patescibacteria group bacterium]|jgi:GT2 family glycosyltransferase|nr:glycosyltransferase family 2 protein [Patescibacteria group bacterium]